MLLRTGGSYILLCTCSNINNDSYACSYNSCSYSYDYNHSHSSGYSYNYTNTNSEINSKNNKTTDPKHHNHNYTCSYSYRHYLKKPTTATIRRQSIAPPPPAYLGRRILYEEQKQPIPIPFPLSLAAVNHLAPSQPPLSIIRGVRGGLAIRCTCTVYMRWGRCRRRHGKGGEGVR